MRKVIAAINLTLDGVCDHTAVDPDEEIHQHYADLLKQAGVTLYGRITYELMKYWKNVVENPTGVAATDDFAAVMDGVPKIVFSRTLKNADWETATLATGEIGQVVRALKNEHGKDILIGSRSLIIQLMALNLVDEYQFCIHPVIAGKGMLLFEQMKDRIILTLKKTKIFQSGAVILYYEPAMKPDR